jgi:glycosyltransferase involved in cell wall biosynthesis
VYCNTSERPAPLMPRVQEDASGVLFVLTSADRRGAETQGRNVATALRQLGANVSLVALSPARIGDGLDVEVIGTKPMALTTLRMLRRRTHGCHTVIAFGSTSLQACAIATLGSRNRLIYRSIGNPRDWVRGRLHRLRTGVFFRRVDYVAALWPEAARSFDDLYGIDSDRTCVIPNFRSSEAFHPAAREDRQVARRTYGYQESDFVVAFVGALSKEKNPELAIAAMTHLPDAKLLVAGDGPLLPTVTSQAADLVPGRVQFLGAVSDVVSVYRAADVLLLTSDTEGMPGVLLEAAFSGVPAASTEVGSVADLARSGLCIETFAPASSAAEAAAAVRRARARSREAILAVSTAKERFSNEAVVTKWAELLGLQ